MHNRRYIIYLLAITLWIVFGIPLSAFCADEYVTVDFTNESRNITQGELALILITSMGIESELPTAPIAADYINLLDKNGIRPLGGWASDKMVTNGDFAVILARAMGLETRLVSPYDIVKENRIYIQNMWEIQYRQDGRRESLEDLLQDARFFPLGLPVCPFGREYTDKDKDYVIDPVSIGPDEKELYPVVKYIVTLRRRGVVLEESPTKILSLRIIRAALQSPVFRSAPLNVYLHGFLEGEAAEVTPITSGGP
jgi:hypothetical protein